jgi:hypothetical protein
MTLATHIVVGAAMARVFANNPAEAFVIGLASHYILDSIVHWDYPISSYSSEKHDPESTKVHFNKNLFFDIAKVSIDVLIGLLIAVAVHWKFFAINSFSNSTSHSTIFDPSVGIILVTGAFAAILPDFIQFVYGSIKSSPLAFLHKPFGLMQKFHHYMHSEANLNDRPFIGVVSQICLILVVSAIVSMFF